jgi:hypothetical protein
MFSCPAGMVPTKKQTARRGGSGRIVVVSLRDISRKYAPSTEPSGRGRYLLREAENGLRIAILA